MAETSTKNLNTSYDRLSLLPDSILCHILSFLPTKFSAATSILSTRWRSIYLSVPIIDLDDSYNVTNSRPRKNTFADFVTNLLLLSGTTTVDEFRLKCWKQATTALVIPWISSVLLRKVSVIELFICPLCRPAASTSAFLDASSAAAVPGELLNCKTLKVLKLFGSFDIKFPIRFDMPNLKVLHLKRMSFQDDSGTTGWILFKCFPLLEDLLMDSLNFLHIPCVNISIPSLKKLKLVWNSIGVWTYDLPKLIVDSPNLEYFGYHGLLSNIDSSILDSVVEADLGFTNKPGGDHLVLQRLYEVCQQFFQRWREELFMLQEPQLLQTGGALQQNGRIQSVGIQERCSRFINKIRNIQNFRIWGITLECLFDNGCQPPEFLNLTQLEVFAATKVNQLKALASIVQRAPNLTKLVFDMSTPEEVHPFGNFAELNDNGLAQLLKEVEVRGFSGTEFEFELVRYLQQCGDVLQTMFIYCSDDIKLNLLEVREKLLNSFKHSTNGKIILNCNGHLFVHTWS